MYVFPLRDALPICRRRHGRLQLPGGVDDGLAGGPSDGGRSAVGAARHGYDRAVTAFQLGPVVLSAPRFYAGLALLVLVVVAELAAWGGRRAARAGEAVEATPAARRDGGEPAAGPGATAARGSTDEA